MANTLVNPIRDLDEYAGLHINVKVIKNRGPVDSFVEVK